MAKGRAQPRARMRVRLWYVVLICGASTWLLSCLYETGERCGPLQMIEDGLCRCAPGTKLLENACVIVETPPPPPPSGPGAACDPATTPCNEAPYTSCETAASGSRYCTSTGCTASGDCPENYACVAGPNGNYCRRPLIGQGSPCATNADCAALDALACATLLRQCVVMNCPLPGAAPTASRPNVCDEGFVCFDAATLQAGLPTLCVPSSAVQR